MGDHGIENCKEIGDSAILGSRGSFIHEKRDIYEFFVKILQGIFLFSKNPEKKGGGCNFSADEQQDALEMAFNKGMDLFSPDSNHSANQEEADESCQENQGSKGEKAEVENTCC